MPLLQTSPPAVLPVSLDEAKAHLRVDIADDDALITTYIAAAAQHVTDHTGRQLITAGFTYVVDGFPPGLIRLPVGPVQCVSSVSYHDGADWRPLATTRWRLMAGQLLPATHEWPRVTGAATVAIDFTAGYGETPDSIPAPMRHAILLLLGYWYEERSAVNVGSLVNTMPFAVDALLAPYRIMTLA